MSIPREEPSPATVLQVCVGRRLTAAVDDLYGGLQLTWDDGTVVTIQVDNMHTLMVDSEAPR